MKRQRASERTRVRELERGVGEVLSRHWKCISNVCGYGYSDLSGLSLKWRRGERLQSVIEHGNNAMLLCHSYATLQFQLRVQYLNAAYSSIIPCDRKSDYDSHIDIYIVDVWVCERLIPKVRINSARV